MPEALCEWRNDRQENAPAAPADVHGVVQQPGCVDSVGDAIRYRPDDPVPHKLKDPVLLALSGLLAASVAAFLLGYIPYPFGLIVLGFFIVARVLSLKATAGKPRERDSGRR